MSRPRVLAFIDWYLPGYKAGGPVRSLANLVDHLRGRVDLHIVTSNTDYTASAPYPGITPDQWTTLPGGEHVWYASQAGHTLATWRRILNERPWDAVYINGLYSRWSTMAPLWLLRRMPTRRIVAVRGMLAHGMMEHGTWKKRAYLSTMKRLGLFRNAEFQATNSEEVGDVRRWIGPQAVVHLVPNLGRKVIAEAPAPRDKVTGRLRLVSVARIAVEKNTLFAIERLRACRTDVVFDLYGTIYDQAYWQRCEQAMTALPPNVQVRHRGPIAPEAVPATLANYHALFMPSQGENFGHALVEALSAGLPLLISDRTPWRGLAEQGAGWDLPLERPDRFEEALAALAALDQRAYDRLSASAFLAGKRYLEDPLPIERSFALFAP